MSRLRSHSLTGDLGHLGHLGHLGDFGDLGDLLTAQAATEHCKKVRLGFGFAGKRMEKEEH